MVMRTPPRGPTTHCAYRWSDGEHYAYRVSCKAEIGGVVLELNGTNSYVMGLPRDMPHSPSGFGPRTGSGTAFAVSPEGYLMTCDHVVRDATSLKVTLGAQVLPCDVVARDSGTIWP